MICEKSCGTVLYTVTDGEPHYLLIRNADGYCGFPKGHVEKDETEEETALRETWEETSVRAEIIGDFRREVSYMMKNGRKKTVIYFLASFEGQTPRHNPGFEYNEFLLLPYREARESLTYENVKEILKEADGYLGRSRG